MSKLKFWQNCIIILAIFFELQILELCHGIDIEQNKTSTSDNVLKQGKNYSNESDIADVESRQYSWQRQPRPSMSYYDSNSGYSYDLYKPSNAFNNAHRKENGRKLQNNNTTAVGQKRKPSDT